MNQTDRFGIHMIYNGQVVSQAEHERLLKLEADTARIKRDGVKPASVVRKLGLAQLREFDQERV